MIPPGPPDSSSLAQEFPGKLYKNVVPTYPVHEAGTTGGKVGCYGTGQGAWAGRRMEEHEFNNARG